MKSVDIKSSTYIDFGKENNEEDRNFKVGDHLRIFLKKDTFQICQKKCLWFKKLKILCSGHMLLINGKNIVGTFYEKELQKSNQEDFRVEKVIKGKGDKWYVK